MIKLGQTTSYKEEKLSITAIVLLGLILGIPYASIVEWTFHRYVMHKPLWGFTYPFKAHALTHHVIFKSDHRYHLQEGPETEDEKGKIRMAWWNIPFVVLMGIFPFVLAATPLVLFGWWGGSIAISVTGLVLSLGYYAAYEYTHWCMHLPKNRRLEFWWVFRKLNGHHLLHHRFQYTNFNVVLPLADFLFGTLLLRSKIKFAQACGPSVPDVQPLEC